MKTHNYDQEQNIFKSVIDFWSSLYFWRKKLRAETPVILNVHFSEIRKLRILPFPVFFSSKNVCR